MSKVIIEDDFGNVMEHSSPAGELCSQCKTGFMIPKNPRFQRNHCFRCCFCDAVMNVDFADVIVE